MSELATINGYACARRQVRFLKKRPSYWTTDRAKNLRCTYQSYEVKVIMSIPGIVCFCLRRHWLSFGDILLDSLDQRRRIRCQRCRVLLGPCRCRRRVSRTSHYSLPGCHDGRFFHWMIACGKEGTGEDNFSCWRHSIGGGLFVRFLRSFVTRLGKVESREWRDDAKVRETTNLDRHERASRHESVQTHARSAGLGDRTTVRWTTGHVRFDSLGPHHVGQVICMYHSHSSSTSMYVRTYM